MQIESIRIKNFRVFQDLTIKNLPNFSVFVGANGTGKTTLFDVFGFLHDALIHNVRQALTRRGGLKEVMSRHQTGNLEFEIKFRDRQVANSLVTYFLEIGLVNNVPLVKREILKYRRGQRGKPWHFLDFQERYLNLCRKFREGIQEYDQPLEKVCRKVALNNILDEIKSFFKDTYPIFSKECSILKGHFRFRHWYAHGRYFRHTPAFPTPRDLQQLCNEFKHLVFSRTK